MVVTAKKSNGGCPECQWIDPSGRHEITNNPFAGQGRNTCIIHGKSNESNNELIPYFMKTKKPPAATGGQAYTGKN